MGHYHRFMRVNINDVSFRSGEETLAGRLYAPGDAEGAEPRPVAVLVHASVPGRERCGVGRATQLNT